jgi:hypothetical protein
MITQKNAEYASKFVCEKCDFICSKKSNFDKHLLTRKHNDDDNSLQKKFCKLIKKYICECGKEYGHRQGLYTHKKKCDLYIKIIENPEENLDENMIENDNHLINIIIKENTEFKKLVLEVIKNNSELLMQNQEYQKQNQEYQKQNQELNKQVLEVCQKIQPTTNNTNTINSHNKTFNLQFFLNEQCKDAMNIMEFVDTFQLQFADLERIGEVGYVEGISSIIINKLNEMDIYKRPIHCSDAKREIMYVKDNDVWDKDNETNDKIRLAIRYISKKNSELVIPWRELHPGVRNYDHRLNDKYQEIIIQSLGGKNTTTEDGETKIIRKISKMVLIDKRM